MSEPSIEFWNVSLRFLDWSKYGRPDPVTQQTYESRKKTLTMLHKDFFVGILVTEINESHILEIRKYMIQKGLESSYIYAVLGRLRALLLYCKEEEKLNVLDPYAFKLPKRERKNVEYLTEKELQIVLGEINTKTQSGLRMMAFITVLLDTGMRITEALSLNRTDIDFGAKRAWIIGKGNKKRMVMFRSWSLKWIFHYLDSRNDDHPALFAGILPRKGKLMRWDDVGTRKYFSKLQKSTGIRKCTAHAMRRTAATFLWKNGADVKSIQHFLGHSTMKTTEFYLGVDYEHIQEVHQKYLSFGVVEKLSPDRLTKTPPLVILGTYGSEKNKQSSGGVRKIKTIKKPHPHLSLERNG